ncbi:unnamed protein product [Rangifer tarandus platyrhynchus]|uniref:Uncharacterized protein n=2 Tax=Rangifer tarandus platyrhynchus TaxID=3082113 RepID=A0ACB0F068_RANTA|nr:unnamed protein product [Rangifer tarandus platyrhynchus]CAI9706219.1 unnamed protein product [Rangifer tarandus platyrhynchus]
MGRSRRAGPDRRIRAEKGNYSRGAGSGFPPLLGSNAAFRMQRRAALFARGVGAPGQEANSQEYRRLGPAAAGAGAGQTRGGRLNPPSSIPPAATQGRDSGRRPRGLRRPRPLPRPGLRAPPGDAPPARASCGGGGQSQAAPGGEAMDFFFFLQIFISFAP